MFFITKLLQIQFQSTISVGQPGFAGRITVIITSGKWKTFYLSVKICAKYDKISENCCTIEKLRSDENKTAVDFVKE